MKQVAILGGLLAVALVGSYVSWTAPESEPAGDVLVIRADASDLDAVTWKDETKTVTLTRPEDDRGAWFRIVSTEQKKQAAAKPEPQDDGEEDAEDDGEEDGELAALDAEPEAAPPEATTVEETTTFAASKEAEDVWKAFTPLYALRELALTPDSDIAAYGLDKPSGTLEIGLKGRTVTVELGSEAYGTRDRYARIDGHVYLLDDDHIRPLQFAASRMVERRVHPYDEGELDELTVTQGENERTFVQKNTDDRAKAYWADADSPDTRDVEATTWLGKLLRMRIRAYEDAEPAGLETVFAFTVEGRDGKRWPVEILKGSKDGQTEYWARSSYTRSLVSLTRSLSEEAIADLPTLFDGVQPEEPEEEAPKAPVPGITVEEEQLGDEPPIE